MLEVHRIVNSLINSCTYVLSVSKECWLIDVGDIEPILDYVKGKCMKGIFLTHVHYDHIYGLNKLVEYFPNTKIYTIADGNEALQSAKMNLSKYHPEIEPFELKTLSNIVLLDGISEIDLTDSLVLKIVPTPGHDVTSVSYELNSFIFSGDSYIPNSKLVCTFPRSNRKLAKENEQLLKNKEKQGYQIMPGHYVEK